MPDRAVEDHDVDYEEDLILDTPSEEGNEYASAPVATEGTTPAFDADVPSW